MVNEEVHQEGIEVASDLYCAHTFIFGRNLSIKTDDRQTSFAKVQKSKQEEGINTFMIRNRFLSN